MNTTQPITSFRFETAPSQGEVRARLTAAEHAAHSRHDQPHPFCALCPPATRGCRTCGGDGFTFHTSPTNGAIELDGPCPTCTPAGAR